MTFSFWFLARGFFYPEEGDDTFIRNDGSQSAATCSRWFLDRVFFYPEVGGDTFLRNVDSQSAATR
jgi:hypothetical protein